jgi:hypothetical protein
VDHSVFLMPLSSFEVLTLLGQFTAILDTLYISNQQFGSTSKQNNENNAVMKFKCKFWFKIVPENSTKLRTSFVYCEARFPMDMQTNIKKEKKSRQLQISDNLSISASE